MKYGTDSATVSDSATVGVQMGPGPRPWIELWLQVQHQFERLQALYRGSAGTAGSQEVQSAVNDFFINCYQLKDHIKLDPAVPAGVQANVEAYMQATPVLELAGDIANTAKHHTRKHGRTARISSWQSSQSGIRVEITATDANGSTTVDALLVATSAVASWQQFITQNGLT